MEEILALSRDYFSFLQMNWRILAIYCGLLTLSLGSGSIAASIAEIRQRSIWLHFFLGLLIPIVYPVFIHLKMSTYSGKSAGRKREEKREQGEGPPPVEIAPTAMEEAPPAIIDSEMLSKPTVIYDQSYFKQIAVDISGNYRGPFQLTIGEEKLKVERIIDSLPTVVMIEFISGDGKLQNMRIPYKSIGACVEL